MSRRTYTGNVRGIYMTYIQIAGLVPSRADSHVHIPQSSLDSFWRPSRPNMQFWFFCVIFQFEVCEMMWNCLAACEKGAFLASQWGYLLYILGCGKVWGCSQLGWVRGAQSCEIQQDVTLGVVLGAVPAAVGRHCFHEGLWNGGRQWGGVGAAAGAWACSQTATVTTCPKGSWISSPHCQHHLGCGKAQSYSGIVTAE